MKSGFGKKLFRLFLLFSLIPSAVLALLGYYLTTESTAFQTTPPNTAVEQLDDYHREFVDERIQSALDAYLSGRDSSELDLHCLYVRRANSLLALIDLYGLVADDSIGNLVRIWEADSGMIDTDAGVLQYRCRRLDSTRTLCGGYLHTRKYDNIMSRIQSEQARQSSGEVIRARFALFLALVFVVVGLITVVVAYLFSSRLARSLSRPLTELSESSRRISDGQFGDKVAPAGVGEVRDLIESFNRMSERLEFTTTRLAQSERVAAWRSVARRFAHELKNPLQPIMISLHRLEKMLRETDHQQQAVEPLKAATDELNHLVDLADRFSQLAKLPEPRPERVNLTELLSSIAALYRDRMDRFRFETELPDHAVEAKLDVTYFREALHNLLQNAADASAEGGRVRLELITRDEQIDIIVEDHGAGMSEETVSAARIPYFTTKEKGKGLGLAIVEKVVTESGGRLYIQSHEGSGTKITITLPRG